MNPAQHSGACDGEKLNDLQMTVESILDSAKVQARLKQKA